METLEGERNEHVRDKDVEDAKIRCRKLLSSAKESFENASRLLRRKIPCTGHLMTPRRLWIQTVPTQECDVILMFPSGAQDFTLMWLLSRLRAGTPGLVVHVRHHASSDSYGFYLTAPFNVLLKAAEEVHLPKTLRSEHGGGLKEFVQQEISCFEGTENEREFFTTQERQWLVLHLLQTLRAGPEDQVGGVKFIEGQAIVPKCVSAGVISQVFPLHDLPELHKLQKEWVRAFLHRQPLGRRVTEISRDPGVQSPLLIILFSNAAPHIAAVDVSAVPSPLLIILFSNATPHITAVDVSAVLSPLLIILFSNTLPHIAAVDMSVVSAI